MDIEEQARERIKSLRGYRRRTQAQLAKAFGKDQRTYADLENGRRRINLCALEIISRELGVPIEYFVVDDERAGHILGQAITQETAVNSTLPKGEAGQRGKQVAKGRRTSSE